MNRAKNLIAISEISYDRKVYNYEQSQLVDTWNNRRGKVSIYELKDGDWSLLTSNEVRGQGQEYFGWEIYLNAEGNVLVVGGDTVRGNFNISAKKRWRKVLQIAVGKVLFLPSPSGMFRYRFLYEVGDGRENLESSLFRGRKVFESTKWQKRKSMEMRKDS